MLNKKNIDFDYIHLFGVYYMGNICDDNNDNGENEDDNAI